MDFSRKLISMTSSGEMTSSEETDPIILAELALLKNNTDRGN
jgi:hypothetical protein